MSYTRLLTIVIFCATSALGNDAFEYLDFQPQLSPLSPNLVYSSGVAGSLGFNEFSYLKDFGGVRSEATLLDGLLTIEPTAQKTKSDKYVETSSVANADASTKTAPFIPEDSKDSTATQTLAKEVDTTTENLEGKGVKCKDPEIAAALINEQILARRGYGAPYPIFRFGGSSSYDPDLTGFSGYEQSDDLSPQYEPFNYFSSYRSANSPLYPWLDADYNHSPTFPVASQPSVSTASEQSNSIGVKSTDSLQNLNIDRKLKDQNVPAEETELPESRKMESTPTTSSDDSSTTSESKEPATTVADPAASA